VNRKTFRTNLTRRITSVFRYVIICYEISEIPNLVNIRSEVATELFSQLLLGSQRNAPHSSSYACCSYQKDKRAKSGNSQKAVLFGKSGRIGGKKYFNVLKGGVQNSNASGKETITGVGRWTELINEKGNKTRDKGGGQKAVTSSPGLQLCGPRTVAWRHYEQNSAVTHTTLWAEQRCHACYIMSRTALSLMLHSRYASIWQEQY
jgi:hypothetical protein